LGARRPTSLPFALAPGAPQAKRLGERLGRLVPPSETYTGCGSAFQPAGIPLGFFTFRVAGSHVQPSGQRQRIKRDRCTLHKCLSGEEKRPADTRRQWVVRVDGVCRGRPSRRDGPSHDRGHPAHQRRRRRWAAAGFVETEKNYRRIMGCQQFWMLKAALDESLEDEDPANTRKAG
jgi:hypothetical protein